MTADDVIFSWQLLRDKGRPNYRTYYVKVDQGRGASASARVRFDLTGADDRELPLILGLMPVLAKHAIDPDTFEDTTFRRRRSAAVPTRSATVKPGDSVTFKRDPNYWGRDLPINRGLWNFDEIRFDYYRDGNTHFEAFKKGLYDVRARNRSRPLADRLRFSGAARRPRRQGGISLRPAQGHARASCSTRAGRSLPTSACARRCCICSTSNGSTTIISSTSTSAPPAISTVAICPRTACRPMRASASCSRRFPAPCAPTSWTAHGQPPVTDGSGRDRNTLRAALALFARGRLRAQRHRARASSPAAGRSPSKFWPPRATRSGWRSPIARNLKRAGIDARVRVVDATQFEQPPHHLRFRHDANTAGSSRSRPATSRLLLGLGRRRRSTARRNYMGVKSKAIDAMIAAHARRATSRDDFVAATRALDRVLMSGFYVVPLYYPPEQWVARWTRHRASRRRPRCSAICRKPGGSSDDRSMILGDRQRGDRRRRSTICSAAPACAAARPRADRSAQPRELHRRRAAPPHLRAGRPRHLGARRPAAQRSVCTTDAVVGMQLPNTVESVIALLGVLRAGMIAAPLPLLWRRARHGRRRCAASAPRRSSPATRVGAAAQAEIADAGRGRAVSDPPCLRLRRQPARRRRAARRRVRAAGRAIVHAAARPVRRRHVAVVTFDVTADGIVPVARSHRAAHRRRARGLCQAGGAAPGRAYPLDDPARLLCRHCARP